MYTRQLEVAIAERLKKIKKTVIVIGPRQTGKTTLIHNIIGNSSTVLFLDGDDPSVRKQLTDISTENLRQLIGKHEVVFIDEAQRIPNIGLTMKIIHDQIGDIQLYASGSSALELNQEIKEPLTGRKWEYQLYPISWKELMDHNDNYLKTMNQLEHRLIYGMYPDVVNNLGDERDILNQLTSSYLYKDILEYKGMRKSDVLDSLLRALAFQVGNEVSYNELSNLIGIDKNTVQSYISLLEQVFVIYRLPPFSRNLRNEIKTTRKIYFYDTGIRNALISNFNTMDFRQDKGVLWENFLLNERMKQNEYQSRYVNNYFWRTKQKQEIDLIEERDGRLFAYEFKYSTHKKVKAPITFTKAYPDAEFKVITPDNFMDFVV